MDDVEKTNKYKQVLIIIIIISFFIGEGFIIKIYVLIKEK